MGTNLGQELLPQDLSRLCKKNGGVSKRIRKRPRQEPHPQVYALKVEALKVLEEMSEQGLMDLVYGDESRISLQPCVPSAWQFKGEDVFMPSAKGQGLNCFALLSRTNRCRFQTTTEAINARFIVEQLETLSFEALRLKRVTVIVLDNAPADVAGLVKERTAFWQQRGLFVFYLPSYSRRPVGTRLNIVEVLWRKLKYQWLRPQDYLQNDALFYRVTQALAAVGSLLKIHFAPFQHNLT